MFAMVHIGFHLTIVVIAHGAPTPPEHASQSGDVILNTEQAIGTVTNNLFAILKFKGVKEKPKLEKFALMQKFLVAQTMKDHFVLKTIAQITKVDKKSIDNGTASFISLINEILDSDRNAAVSDEDNGNSMLAACITQKLVNNLDNYFATMLDLHTASGTYGPVAINLNKDILEMLGNKTSSASPNYRTQNVSQDIINNHTEFDENVPSNATFTGHDHDEELIPNTNPFWEPHKSAEEVSGRRIFGGKKTKAKHYPFVVSLSMFNQFQCGGSILSDEIVITAASCVQIAHNNRFYRENPMFLAVRVGSNFYNDGGELIPVLEIYFHPEYTPKTLNNNLALLRLSRAINFAIPSAKRRVKRIDIDQRASPLPLTINGVTIVGWGASAKTNILKNPFLSRIKYDVLDYYPIDDCQEIYGKKFVTKQNFCAGFMSKGGGACNRDVGGPGVVGGILMGVVSFGSPVCGTPDAPTVFTKLGYYADWIQTILAQSHSIPRIRQISTTLMVRTPPDADGLNQFTTPFTIYPLEEIEENNTFTPPVIIVSSSTSIQEYGATHSQKEMLKDFLKVVFNSEEADRVLKAKLNNETGTSADKTVIEQLPEEYQQILDMANTLGEPSPEYEITTESVNVVQQKDHQLIDNQLLNNIVLEMQAQQNGMPPESYLPQQLTTETETPQQVAEYDDDHNDEPASLLNDTILMDISTEMLRNGTTVDDQSEYIKTPNAMFQTTGATAPQHKKHKRKGRNEKRSKRKPGNILRSEYLKQMGQDLIAKTHKKKKAEKSVVTDHQPQQVSGQQNSPQQVLSSGIYHQLLKQFLTDGGADEKSIYTQATKANTGVSVAADLDYNEELGKIMADADVTTNPSNDQDPLNMGVEAGAQNGAQDYVDDPLYPNEDKNYAHGESNSPYLANNGNQENKISDLLGESAEKVTPANNVDNDDGEEKGENGDMRYKANLAYELVNSDEKVDLNAKASQLYGDISEMLLNYENDP